MKKILVLLCIMVFVFASIGNATPSFENNLPVAWKSIVLNNISGIYVIKNVPTTTIRPGKSILGYVIIPLADATTHSEAVVGLYDGPGGANTVADEMFDEAEADGKSLPSWFPYPRKILTQLNVHIGPNTRVLIYWE